MRFMPLLIKAACIGLADFETPACNQKTTTGYRVEIDTKFGAGNHSAVFAQDSLIHNELRLVRKE